MAEIINISFGNKSHFPTGKWKNEPDFMSWEAYNLSCFILRDIKLGMLRGLVGVNKKHPLYGKSFREMLDRDWILDILPYNGLSLIGKLGKSPYLPDDMEKGLWYLGFECVGEEDFIPLLENDKSGLLYQQYNGNQTYKDIVFVMKEVNRFAKEINKIKTF